MEAVRGRALHALVQLRVRVPELNRDVSDLLLEMLHCVHGRNCAHKSRLSVRNMPNSSDVYCGLSRNNFRGKRVQLFDFQTFKSLGS